MANVQNEVDAQNSVPIVAVEELHACEVDSVFSEKKDLDFYDYQKAFYKHAKEAESEKRNTASAWRMLAGLIGMSFAPENSAEPFKAMWVDRSGRSMVPADLKGPQTIELSKFASNVSDPVIRARIADVAWLNNRSDSQSAIIAFDAYCEQLENTLCRSDDLDESNQIFDQRVASIFRRAFAISRAIKGKRDFPDKIVHHLNKVFDHSIKGKDVRSLTLILQLIADFGVLLTKKNADLAMEVFDNLNVWSFNEKDLVTELARMYQKLENPKKSNDCKILIAECSIKMAAAADHSAMVSAGWLMNALEELSLANGIEARDRYREIKKLLRDKQEETTFEMQSFSNAIDISDLVKDNLENFAKFTLGESLGAFASITVSESPDVMREHARGTITKFPLSSMFGSSRLDREGKIITNTSAADLSGSNINEAIEKQVCDNMGCRRQIVVMSGIKPVRNEIYFDPNFSEKKLEIIVGRSPFVPPFHEFPFVQGFKFFFQGEMVAATSILVPQFENSLRYVLKTAGIDTSTIESDSTQVDRSISALLDRFRGELVSIFSEPVVFEIDMLFNSRLGPALRHQLAHGKLTGGEFYSYDAVYACWFIFRLCCLPLFSNWDKIAEEINR